jgi:hypothetical protein
MKNDYVMATSEECTAPLNDYCSSEETYPDCINCKYYKPMKETTLSEMINYIRSANIGDLIFRRNLVDDFGYGSTVDNYRNYLTHAGYLRIKSRGVYEYMKEIPEDMTYKQLVHEAYPNSEWTCPKNNKKIIPKDLEEAIARLIEDNKNDLKKIPKNEDSFIGQHHHSVGMWIRNEWGLWTGSELQTWFKERGIHHADDMSGIIMASFHRRINEKEINLESQIKKYRKYWAKVDTKVNEGKM